MKQVLLIFFSILFLFSCKKGEEDPYLSLLSRKTRLVGKWKPLKSETYSKTTTYFGYIEEITKVDDDSVKYSFFVIGGAYVEIASKIKEFSIEFNNDGSWTLIKSLHNDFYHTHGLAATWKTYSTNQLTSGYWTFGNKINGEYKNKERLILDVLYDSVFTSNHIEKVYYGMTDDTSYINREAKSSVVNKKPGDEVIIYDLLRLANKEMKWYSNLNQLKLTGIDNSDTNTVDFEYSAFWIRE